MKEVEPVTLSAPPGAQDVASPETMLGVIDRLQSSLGRLEVALGSLRDAVAWTDAEGQIVWCNPAFDRLSNRPHLSILGKPAQVALALRSATGEPVVHPLARALQNGPGVAAVQETLELVRPGNNRTVEVTASVVQDAQSRLNAVLIARDITERFTAENWLERDGNNLDLLNRFFWALQDSPSAAAAAVMAIRLVSEHAKWRGGRAWIVDGPDLKLVAQYLAPDLELLLPQESASPSHLALQVAFSGAMDHQAAPDPTWPEELSGQKCEMVAVPLLVEDGPCGVIEWILPSGEELPDAIRIVAGHIASQLGRVVESHRFRDSLLSANRELEARVTARTEDLGRSNVALRETMGRYRGLIQSVRDVLFSVGPNGRIDSLNPAFVRATGFRPADWLGKRVMRLIEPEDRRLAWERSGHAQQSGLSDLFEIRIRNRAGQIVILECSLAPRFEGGAYRGVTGTARDVTERNRQAAQLQLRDRAMAATSEGICITDPSMPGAPIVYVNTGFERLTGYASSEVIGSDLSFLEGVETSPDAVMALSEAIQGEKACVVELRNYRKDGTPFWNRISMTPVRDSAGRLINFIAVHTDITDRKENERLKNELISTVSHELRTPLTSLRGFAELMLARDFAPEKQRKFIEIIYKESTRLSNLINDFLDLQRMESGRQSYQMAPVWLEGLLEESLSLFRTGNPGHQFVLDVPEPVPAVRADADRLRQVLANLLSNAVKFSPLGGAITVGCRMGDDGKAVCRVADQGVGIPESAIGRLFQKFYRVDNTETRKIGGTGLGLALVKELITGHGGDVWVESAQGEGSTFYFSVPLDRPEGS